MSKSEEQPQEQAVYRSIGRGGGGNMFKTTVSESKSPKLIPVSSAGHSVPADQKKFSISRGGYGNIRDNKAKKNDNSNEANIHSNDVENIDNEEFTMAPLSSVKSIGRGGFGNQIKNIKSHESQENNKNKSFFDKISSLFK